MNFFNHVTIFIYGSACHLSVMLAIGNTLSNSVYEATIRNGLSKPAANSSREEKEKWIRCKYEAKEFLPESNRSVPNGQQLVEAVVRFVCDLLVLQLPFTKFIPFPHCRSDMKALVLALARCSTDDVNATVSARDLRTSLHLACAMGNLAMAQLLIWVSFRNPLNPFQK